MVNRQNLLETLSQIHLGLDQKRPDERCICWACLSTPEKILMQQISQGQIANSFGSLVALYHWGKHL